MFVLHADCNNNWRKCQVCSESPPNDHSSASQQCQSLEQSERSNSSPTTTGNNPTLDRNIDQTTTTAVNPGCYVENPSDLPEPKKQRLMEENAFHQQEDHITEEGEAAAIANNNNDIRSTTSSVIQDEVGISIAEPKCDNFPIAIDSVNTDEKMEHHLKEEKDPIIGADLVVVDFDVSLVHNQSRVEALLLSRTFIGGSSAYRSSSSFTSSNDGICPYDDTVINVEYQGDNIIGYFDSYGNHAFKSSGGQRRLFGPVYSVRKYKPSADTEVVYAVIIWIDAAVKDKAEIEITSFDDYFELLKLS